MAVDALDIRAQVTIEGTVEKNFNSGRNARAQIAMGELARMLVGTGAAQMDTVHYGEYTITSGGTLSIDLSGSLRSPAGDVSVFAELAMIYVVNKPADGNETPNVGTIQIGGGSNCIPLFADATDMTQQIGPGGQFFLVDPDAGGICTVTAGTGDLLRITQNASGASAKVQVFLGGRSA